MNYAELQAEVRLTIGAVGAPCTVQVSDGLGGFTAVASTAVFLNYKDKTSNLSAAATNVVRHERKVLLSVQTGLTTVTPRDRIVDASGVTWRVEQVTVLCPDAQTNLLFILRVVR